MSPKDVRESVAKIAKQAESDYDGAHSAEDSLYESLLQAIADGTCRFPAACAREALQSKKIAFTRHCA